MAAELAAHGEAFAKLVPPDARVEKLVGGMQFTEGPVWIPLHGGFVVFSDIPGNELKTWSAKKGLKTFRKPSGHGNGNTLDREGHLITCHHFPIRAVTITDDATAQSRLLVDQFQGKRFNSPNDVVVKSDDSVWFTDPTYGLKQGKPELDKNYVFRLDRKTNQLSIVASDFDMPNGLCFSPDEKRLYIADSGKPHHVRVFDVQDDGTLKGGEVFCVIDKGVPDGMRCDQSGNLWSSAGDGIHVFSPDGTLLGKILVDETPANLCFGGPDGKTLFIAARTSLYAIKTAITGAGRKN